MEGLRHDNFINQLESLKVQYPEFNSILDKLIKEVENHKNRAMQEKLKVLRKQK